LAICTFCLVLKEPEPFVRTPWRRFDASAGFFDKFAGAGLEGVGPDEALTKSGL
jgi:hypothetical protein